MSSANLGRVAAGDPSLPQRLDRRHLGLIPLLVFYAALLVYPMGLVASRAFTSADTDAFSVENFTALVTEPVFRNVIFDTLRVATITTAFCVVRGYTVAYVICHLGRIGRLLEALVIIPLMTSVLVRAFVWIALLEDRGIINSALKGLGIISAPVALVYNETGVIIGMVHVMLPFTIIPMIAVFRSIDPRLARASESLGANPWTTFWRVYLPLSLPGVYAGGALCFVLSLGFFTTPAMLGGGQTMLLAQLIDVQIQRLLQLNQASALALSLIALALIVWVIVTALQRARRLIGTESSQ
ncbi:MAG: ABC transporter permease [Mycobacterium sp.]